MSAKQKTRTVQMVVTFDVPRTIKLKDIPGEVKAVVADAGRCETSWGYETPKAIRVSGSVVVKP
ncbi:hypothetical protein UFOVP747_49 [uncultured Caudovirales phage]|uniref:Uncharacterized protein n=1 Tax=uncultured Caudovirales phage TaxID=2100421 RepID=A0A6J7X9K9_9CAUD|nr:hypothetical protein UFOVP675_50 [uncultured Caudovirales phage]CAB5225574.1 hypothetical protein UFOVP747_49 [uncultured Caudovirales phage]